MFITYGCHWRRWLFGHIWPSTALTATLRFLHCTHASETASPLEHTASTHTQSTDAVFSCRRRCPAPFFSHKSKKFRGVGLKSRGILHIFVAACVGLVGGGVAMNTNCTHLGRRVQLTASRSVKQGWRQGEREEVVTRRCVWACSSEENCSSVSSAWDYDPWRGVHRVRACRRVGECGDEREDILRSRGQLCCSWSDKRFELATGEDTNTVGERERRGS